MRSTKGHPKISLGKTLRGQLSPIRIVLMYTLFAGLWIGFSDKFLLMLVSDPQLLLQISMFKGFLFVLITALLLWLLLRVWHEPQPSHAPHSPSQLFSPKKSRFALILLGIFALPPLFGLAITHLHGPAMEQEAHANLQAIAELKAGNVGDWLEERRADGLVFVENRTFAQRLADYLTNRNEAIARNLSQRLLSVQNAYGERGFSAIYIVTVEGEPLISATGSRTLPESSMSLLEQSLKTGQTLHSPVYQDAQGDWHLDFIVPLHDTQAQAVGAVIMHVDPRRYLFPMAKRWPGLGKGTHASLLQAGDNHLHFLSPEDSLHPHSLTMHNDLPVVLQPSLNEDTDEMRLAAWSPIEGTDWILLVSQLRNEILAPLHALASWVSIITFFASVVIAAVFMLLWQYQRRIAQLALKAQENEIGQMLHYFYALPLIGMAVLSFPQRQWLRVNDELCTILGYPRDELLKRSWDSLIASEMCEQERASFLDLIHGVQKGYQQELNFIHHNGSVVVLLVNLQVVPKQDGSVDFLIATLQDVSERKQRDRQIQRQRDLYNTLSHTNQAIVRHRHPEELFEEICQICVEYGGFSFVRIQRHDKQQDRLRSIAQHSKDHQSIPLDTALPGSNNGERDTIQESFLNRGEMIIYQDLLHESSLVDWHDALRNRQIAAMAIMPIKCHGELYGSLCLYAGEVDFFDDDILATVLEMTTDLNFALDNFARNRKLAVANQVVEASPVVLFRWKPEPGWPLEYVSDNLRRWGYQPEELISGNTRFDGLIHPDDRDRVRQEVDHYARQRINSYIQVYRLLTKSGNSIWVEDKTLISRDRNGDVLHFDGIVTDITERKEAEDRFRALVEQSLVGVFILRGNIIDYANPRSEAIFGYAAGETTGMHLKSFIKDDEYQIVTERLAHQLMHRIENEEFIITGIRKDGGQVMVGAHTSIASVSGELVLFGVLQDISEKLEVSKQVNAYTERLEAAIQGTVNAVSYMVELRDPYTSGHERRVGEIAAAIAAELGQDEDFQQSMHIIGSLHDVGKITVPAEILSKPGRLNEMEYRIVQAHAQQGYEILSNVEFPWPVAEAVLQHHERIDGSGYPQGLKGGQILLEARIIAVADVIESMASHRPYRPGIGIDVALEEIESGAGKTYDPQVAAACLRLFREKTYQIPQ
ncbi:MAG: PAS domain S-box protein [Gammaproteobacteria bacterium]|nr:PAS domain S-box protein [Gammaproteobacteria bacterium]